MNERKIPWPKFLAVLLLSCGLPCVSSATETTADDAIPAAALSAGYTLHSFHSKMGDDINIAGNDAHGFNWYYGQFFGTTETPTKLTRSSDGVTLSATGANGSTSGSITTGIPCPSCNSDGFFGVAFGGGGYFEAQIAFNPEDVLTHNPKGALPLPAFYLLPVEFAAQMNADQWPGQEAGYIHYSEPDIFEYNRAWRTWGWNPQNQYGADFHDWYGLRYKTCPKNGFDYCVTKRTQADALVVVPKDTDFTQFHKYGLLWVPATATSPGYAQYYFDRTAVTPRITWKQLTKSDAPPPEKQPWLNGITDWDHFLLVFSTGVDQPMNIKSVDVWQGSEKNNYRR